VAAAALGLAGLTGAGAAPAALNKHQWAGTGSVSCAAPGRCSTGGGYQDGSDRGQAFVVSQPPMASADPKLIFAVGVHSRRD
jgi:hypothetical protein